LFFFLDIADGSDKLISEIVDLSCSRNNMSILLINRCTLGPQEMDARLRYKAIRLQFVRSWRLANMNRQKISACMHHVI